MNDRLRARFSKSFANGPTIHADLDVASKGFNVAVLFGPSGGGKTTVLRCLAGLDRPTEGFIRFGDETWFDAGRKICLAPQRRGIGFLFQDYALFPHLTAARNISFGLANVRASERKRLVGEMLDRFGLGGLGDRYPRQLSGGQQQRVALARSLALRPRLLMLDEPLVALDEPTRLEVRRELRRLLAQFDVPTVLVTHDRTEALALGDQVVVMIEGQVRQTGAVHEVFGAPNDVNVAKVVGTDTILPGLVESSSNGLAMIRVGGTRLFASPASSAEFANEVYVCIRAEDVILQPGPGRRDSARNHLPARIAALTSEGPLIRVQLDCGFPLACLVTRPACEELALREGEEVTAVLKAQAVHLIPRA